MRRHDREVTDEAAIRAILDDARVCRLAFWDEDIGAPYIVPLSYGYDYGKAGLRLIFHSAQNGRKLELLRKNPRVGFELDCGYELLRADTACGHSCRFASIIGAGEARVIEAEEDRIRAVHLLIMHVAGRNPPVQPGVFAHTILFEVTADMFSAKRRV